MDFFARVFLHEQIADGCVSKECKSFVENFAAQEQQIRPAHELQERRRLRLRVYLLQAL